jgi:hypothetical protein
MLFSFGLAGAHCGTAVRCIMADASVAGMVVAPNSMFAPYSIVASYSMANTLASAGLSATPLLFTHAENGDTVLQ